MEEMVLLHGFCCLSVFTRTGVIPKDNIVKLHSHALVLSRCASFTWTPIFHSGPAATARPSDSVINKYCLMPKRKAEI